MAFDAEVARIRSMDDRIAAFADARTLVRDQLDYRREAADLTASLAHEIREGGELSVRRLAERLRLPKGQAQRMLERAEREAREP